MRCLESLSQQVDRCVYVDSGSRDKSVEEARSRGVSVVPLDMSTPFTAARARNAGFNYLTGIGGQFEYVHFVDGDCEILPGWVARAQSFLDQHPEVGIVFGLQRERFPERSIYNQLLDVEWHTPFGEVDNSGGLFVCRHDLFQRLGGFREDLIAGEEPELCLRVRQSGFKVWHLDEPMALHDGAMTHFSQWWRRTKRSGYAYAEGFSLHGQPPINHFRKQLHSAFFWALILPLLIGAAADLVSPWWLLGFLAYPIQVMRIALRGRHDARTNWLYATFVVLGKVPELRGVARFYWYRFWNRQKHLIEYK